MPRRIILVLGLLPGMLSSPGCDRTPTPPQAVIDASNAPETEPPRPTTQELLSGTYRKFMLPDTPLSVQAPESWAFTTAGSVRLLEGPSPADQAIIQISHPREPLSDERAEALISQLKTEAQADTSPISQVNVRQSGTMRILERLSTSKPITNPKLDSRGAPVFDAQNNPVMVTTTAVEWALTAFIPEGAMWKRYELIVIGLTTDNYETDRPLLEKILYSLKHETGPATGPGA